MPSFLRAIFVSCAIAGLSAAVATPAVGQRRIDPREDSRIAEETSSTADDSLAAQGLRPVEQGVADVTAIGRSLRVLHETLRVPSGFSEVYAVPGRPDHFMRVNGGLYIVFPQSVYDEEGPLVPDDAVFHIGSPFDEAGDYLQPGPFEPGDGTRRLRLAQQVESGDLSFRLGTYQGTSNDTVTRATGSTQQFPPPSDDDVPSIIDSRIYRTQRIRALLSRAVTIERAVRTLEAARTEPAGHTDTSANVDDVQAADSAADSDE